MTDDRVILFDLGRVLIDFDHTIAVKKMMHFCTLDEKGIYNLFFDSGITDKYERGLISSPDFFKEAKRMLSAEINYQEFVPIWNEIFTPHPGMREIVESLKDNYGLYMASNINKLHFEYLHERFNDCSKFFNYLFLSYELGLRKPDLKFYRYVLDYLKQKPQDVIYTDDRIELVFAAKELGIDAFQFISTDLFKEELAKRNIKFDLILNKGQ